ADIGIALDGDGDRVLLIDENGEIIDGDKILAILAKSWQRKRLLSNQYIVGTLMSNLGLERYLNKLNLKLARSAVGD
ncbi:phosphoglucosamine mutase, partial [Escherichia coli]|nr:phosphoglucosamine mutase [Escherichia coli]